MALDVPIHLRNIKFPAVFEVPRKTFSVACFDVHVELTKNASFKLLDQIHKTDDLSDLKGVF